MARRGAFILLEGIDRTGKTTQCKALAQYLRTTHKMNVEELRFPARTTEIGSMIDGYLKNTKDLDDQAIHLLFSANRWESAKKIRETLLSGTSIVMDRYAFSGVAYSASKGLKLEWCKGPDRGLPGIFFFIFLFIFFFFFFLFLFFLFLFFFLFSFSFFSSSFPIPFQSSFYLPPLLTPPPSPPFPSSLPPPPLPPPP